MPPLSKQLLSGKAQPPITQERFEEYVSRCCVTTFPLAQVLTTASAEGRLPVPSRKAAAAKAGDKLQFSSGLTGL